jgi:hypothetical protein
MGLALLMALAWMIADAVQLYGERQRLLKSSSQRRHK